MPKVSVIVPVYKAEAFIEACARSLFGQTLEDMEYIFVDDCSPDRSIEILKAVLRDYPSREKQVRIIALEKNAGVAKVREIGLSVITGDYFIYCDSDDYVDLDAYEKMYSTALQEQSDAVVCDILWENSEKIINKNEVATLNKVSFISDILEYKIPVSLCNKLFSKILSQNLYYSKYGFGEDMVMAFQMSYRANRISYLPNTYYYYRQNDCSVTHDFSDAARIYQFVAMRHNMSIFERVLCSNKKRFSKSLLHCQYYSKKNLIYKISSTNFKAWWQWVVSFPGLTFHLKNLSIPIKERLFFYLAYIGITPYSYLYKIFHRKE